MKSFIGIFIIPIRKFSKTFSLVVVLQGFDVSAVFASTNHCKSGETVVFHCSLTASLQKAKQSPNRTTNELRSRAISICQNQADQTARVIYGVIGSPLQIISAPFDSLQKPDPQQKPAMAWGRHDRPGGYSIAFSAFNKNFEMTIDAGFETAIDKSIDKEISDYSVDITDLNAEESIEHNCQNPVTDKLMTLGSKVPRIDYFSVLEGIAPKKQPIGEDEAQKAIEKELLQERERLARRFPQNTFRLYEAGIPHGLSGDFDADGTIDHVVFVETTAPQAELSKIASLRSIRFDFKSSGEDRSKQTKTATDASTRLGLLFFLSSGSETYFMDLKRINTRGTPMSDLDLSLTAHAKIPPKNECLGDALLFEHIGGIRYFLCRRGTEFSWRKEYFKAEGLN